MRFWENRINMRDLSKLLKPPAFVLLFILSVPPAWADSANIINAGVNDTLARFVKEVAGAESFLKSAKAALIFPKVYKAGIGIGGEYGEGALRVGGKTVAYYSTAAASIGFQLGGQVKSIIVLFMQDEALRKFRDSDGWKAGVDGSIAVVDTGAGRELSTQTIKDPIVGFIFDQKGLMFNLTLEGSKFTQLDIQQESP